MLWPKKIHTRNVITKKNSCGLKIPLPPYNFSNALSLRHEMTKLQTATVISLWFWGLLAYPERYSDWPVHNQHSWKISVVHGFLSFSAKVHVVMYCQYLKSISQSINQSINQANNQLSMQVLVKFISIMPF